MFVPKFTKKEFEKCISKHFGIGKLISCKKFEKGLANPIYHIKTTKGDFVFKIAVRNNPERVRYEVDLLNLLRGLQVPKPLRTKSGKYIFDYKNHKAFLYKFLLGDPKNNLNATLLWQVGKFLGKFHNQSKNFKHSVKRIKFYNLSASKVKKLLARVTNKKVRKALLYIKENMHNCVLPKNITQGAMHMDLKPENVLFYKGKLSGVVDFDNSHNGYLVFDLMHTIMWFCARRGDFDFRKAKVLYLGYQSVRKLPVNERNFLLKALRSAFLGHTLHAIEYSVNKKLPKRYAIWIINNFLEADKNFNIVDFNYNILQNDKMLIK